MKKEDEGCAGGDFVIPGPAVPGGNLCMRHSADHTMKVGMMGPVQDGAPLPDSAVLLEKRDGADVYDVVGSVADMRSAKGPAKVTSESYRSGWDAVFKGKDVN
jgi:hypothetical protein